MSQSSVVDPHLCDTLHQFALHGEICAITLREGSADRQIIGVLSSATADSIVLHESGTASIHIYPTACVIDARIQPEQHAHARRRLHPAETVDAMRVQL
jgi:hypothetical protein